ncbi:zinc finger, CCHC-type containing protein [Tanacetum coccineum]
MAEDSSSKKFLISNFNDYKRVDSRPVMEQYNELLRIFGQYTQHGLKMDESISVSSIIDNHLRIEESLRAQDGDKGKGKEVVGPSMNMTEEGKNKNNKQTKERNVISKNTVVVRVPTRNLSWNVRSVVRLVTSRGIAVVVDAIAWWIDSGATTHVCKDRCWFKTYEPVEDRSVLYMGDDHFAPVHGKGSVVLEFSSGKSITLFNVLYVPKLRFGYYNNGMFMLNLNKVPDDSDSVYMSYSAVVNSLLWHARLGHVHYKRMLEMSKDELIPAIDENPDKYEALDKFRIYKTEVELQQNDLIKTLRIDRGGEYYDLVFFQSVGIIHETTAPYTPQQNGVAERKNRALKEMVNSFWGCRAVVRLPDPKRKTLSEKDIDCIFVGYAEHSKAYRFYVIEPNDSVSINSIIESRDAIFDENRFSSIPRPKDIIPNSDESQREDHSDDVPSEIPGPRKGKRVRKAKLYGSDFQLYLVEGSRDQVGS